MKVGHLIELLKKYNPEAEIIIHRDCQNYGFGFIDKIITGVFELTDYGNDFNPDQAMIVNPAQVKAVCIFPEDYLEPPKGTPFRTH
jgi:hypothetical protein